MCCCAFPFWMNGIGAHGGADPESQGRGIGSFRTAEQIASDRVDEGGDRVVTGTGELVDPGSPGYRNALSATPHDSYHLPGWIGLDASLEAGTATAYRYTEGDHSLLLPLVLRAVPGTTDRVDALSPYGYPGPVADPDADVGFWRRAAERLPETLRAVGAVACFVRLHPLLEPPATALDVTGTLVTHGQTVWLDLTRSEQLGWADLRQNHRRQVARARRDGLVTRWDDWSRLADFVQMYHQTMARVGAQSAYRFAPGYFDDLVAALGDGAHLAVVEDAAEVIGGGIFLGCHGVLQYHLGATRDGALARQPAKLMMDDARRWGRAQGFAVLHLGGGVGGRVDDSLFHFKAGFGPLRATFRTWRVVVDPDAYRELVTRSGGPEPGFDDTGYFPAYRHGTS